MAGDDDNSSSSKTTIDAKPLQNQPSSEPVRSPYHNGYKGKNYDPAKAARSRGAATRGGRHFKSGRSGGRYQGNQGRGQPWGQFPFNQNSQNQYPQQWAPPLSTYPSQPYQAHFHTQQQMTQAPSEFNTGNNALNYSDMGSALSNLQLNYNDPQWYMDTGASSHITANPESASCHRHYHHTHNNAGHNHRCTNRERRLPPPPPLVVADNHQNTIIAGCRSPSLFTRYSHHHQLSRTLPFYYRSSGQVRLTKVNLGQTGQT